MYPTFPQSCACGFFSVLAPAGRGGGQGLDTSLSGLYLAGLPGGSAASWAANKFWPAFQEVRQQALQTSFEAIALRYGLKQLQRKLTV